jgi:hypothetical protein
MTYQRSSDSVEQPKLEEGHSFLHPYPISSLSPKVSVE